ncbi:hypothetical protein N7449_007033 [Penicillium cf. viridicatum]|uniref:Uncharacterized protein n=1 Tax=Penicillium cf. viridicatum TaxID=2972119 RepID=A0A9W9MCA2_9EURO|nr:hypothetical protein N7449_007033 [Penicillium cf. viridicatum]
MFPTVEGYPTSITPICKSHMQFYSTTPVLATTPSQPERTSDSQSFFASLPLSRARNHLWRKAQKRATIKY